MMKFSIILGLLIALLMQARSADAQIVRGQVVDSISQSPIEGGSVLLLATDGSEVGRTVTDPEGLFLVRANAPGEYQLIVNVDGYRRSEFPAFTLEAEQVRGFMLLVAPLAEPAPPQEIAELEEIVSRMCPEGVAPGLPVIMGIIRDAEDGEPVAQADVKLVWSSMPDVLISAGAQTNSEGAAVSGSTGFYGICGAPLGVRVLLHASEGGRLSDIAALRFDDGGVYVGETFQPLIGRILRHDFELRDRPARTASLTGTVVDTSGTHVADAQVSIVGTNLVTTTNFLGVFRFTNLPGGTLRLAAERIGYQPTQADVRINAEETVELPRDFLQMIEAPTQLEPITVTAERPETRRDLSEFFKRRESSSGSYITREEFEKMGNVLRTTDVLRRMRGIYIRNGTGALEYLITTRRGSARTGTVSGAGNCFPLVYMDRLYVGTTATMNVNYQIPITNLEAVEVHSSASSLPPEFNRPGATCGVIVFWTR